MWGELRVCCVMLVLGSVDCCVCFHCNSLFVLQYISCVCIYTTGALMGLSSLAVMGNSLTLQLYKGPKLVPTVQQGKKKKQGLVEDAREGLAAGGDALPV